MKYIVEIQHIDKLPDNWASKSDWPEMGIYWCKSEPNTLYHVYEYGVNYISSCQDFVKRKVTDEELSPVITEQLLLKAIAAASRAEKLK
jgi:hypothetical protein